MVLFRGVAHLIDNYHINYKIIKGRKNEVKE